MIGMQTSKIWIIWLTPLGCKKGLLAIISGVLLRWDDASIS